MLLVFNQDYIKGSCVAVLQFFSAFVSMCVLHGVMH